jgi:RND family efflux transporter MFP subunit
MMTVGGGAEGDRREYPGRVAAAEEIQLSFEVSGRVTELNAREGEAVAAGALIAALDPRDFQATYDRELAKRNQARADYERNQTLYARDAISLRDLEVVKRRFEVTQADLKQAQKALADTRLYAPFDGKIAGRLVERQENVQSKQPIVLFHDDSSLEIEASFPETDFLRIRDLGTLKDATSLLKPVVEISAAPGRQIPAWMKELRRTADPVTRTYAVTLGFEAPQDLAITSGMTARVAIQIPGDLEATLIPTAAVVAAENNQSKVWVFDAASGTVSSRAVTVGQITGDQVEILDGLHAGDRIAVQGATNLREGMQVRPLGE